MSIPSILKKILKTKHEELMQKKEVNPFNKLADTIEYCEQTRPFKKSIAQRVLNKKAAVIAELKKASPSSSVICKEFNPSTIAVQYETAGATCLSVLTDTQYFAGHDKFLTETKAACSLPILRKDFIIDPWQIYESRVLGADCILLIAAALKPKELQNLYNHANKIGLNILIEVHNNRELEEALPLEDAILGINNRNLHTFETALETTYNLLPLIPKDRVVVTESGIKSQNEISKMVQHDVYAFLVGESLMKTPHPGKALQSLFLGTL